MRYLTRIGADAYTVGLEDHEAGVRVEVDGAPMSVDLMAVDGDRMYSLLIDGRSCTATMLEAEDRYLVAIDGTIFDIDVEQEDLARLRQEVKRKTHAGGEQIKAPMPGRVIAIEVSVGDTVAPGKGVIVIEAMKMENELRAHTGGIVKDIRVSVGDAVNKNDVLVILHETAPDT